MPSMALRHTPATWQEVPAPPPVADIGLAAAAPGLAVSYVDLCSGVQVLCCGHVIHQQCYLTAVDHQNTRVLSNMLHEAERLLDPDKDELLCPLCRRVVNGLLPLTANVHFTTASLPPLTERLDGAAGCGDLHEVARALQRVRMVPAEGAQSGPMRCLGSQFQFWSSALSKATSVNLVAVRNTVAFAVQ